MTIDPFTNSPIVVLKDLDDKRAVPIWIGLVEASAIAMELEKVKLPRPMTHDLLRNVIHDLGGKVIRVEVCDLRDNTFYANIHLNMEGIHYAIDARPSDGIALALRTKAPIYVKEEVIEKARKIDLRQGKEGAEGLDELLEHLTPKDFGKYKM